MGRKSTRPTAMPEPAPASHPSPSGLKRWFPGGSLEVHTRSMYDILIRLLCPFISMFLRSMYRILLLSCVLSMFLWLFQLDFDIQHLVISTRPWEQPVNPQLQLFTSLWGDQPENPQLEVEMLAAAVVVLQCLQFIFCRERFRRNGWLVQWGAWATYYVPLPLAAFAVGVMLKFRCPYWLVAIFFAAGQADSMAAYRLDDDSSQKVRRFAKRTLMLAYLILALLQVQGGFVSYQQQQQRRRPIAEMYSLALGLFVFLVHLKITSMEMISSSDICSVAAEAVRTKRGHRTKTTIHARRAVVAVGSLESRGTAVSGCTTYEDILQLNYSLELKDACLSSASFLHQLQRYSKTQSQVRVVDSSPSMNNHVSKILQADKNIKDGYARAFKIVEAELSFLYDYLFTTHGSPSHTSYRLYFDYSISKIGFLFSILSLVYPAGDEEEAAKAKPEISASVYAVYALVLLELCQLVVYLTSNWLVVSVICDRAKNSRHTKSPLLLRILGTRAGSQQRRWQNELGQYVLIENCHRTSLKERLLGRLLRLRQRGTLSSSVALSDEMKGWVLEKAAADPSESIRFPIADEPSLTWGQDTEVRTILIWHIATWFCANTEEEKGFPTNVRELHSLPEYGVAVTLSRYCAYLVAFRPELLPGHHTTAASVIDEAIREAELFSQKKREAELHLHGQTSPDQGILKYGQTSPDQGILKLGMKLGRHLMDMEGSSSSSSYKYWETIAIFWTEMLLHVSQAGNVSAHIEHLAKGGEFVTHLWALLSHAGIKRNSLFDIKQTKDNGAAVSHKRHIAVPKSEMSLQHNTYGLRHRGPFLVSGMA